jgi:UPF0176 protein
MVVATVCSASETTNDADQSIVVSAFYLFTALPDYESLQPELKQFMLKQEIRGTIIVSPEGVNGTVSGSREAIDALYGFFQAHEKLKRVQAKESFFHHHPFARTKVKRKKEIISLGRPVEDPEHHQGHFLDAEAWNRLLEDPDVVLLDTRNDYEIHLGTFEGAVNPKTRTFKELPQWLDSHLPKEQQPKIAMFCTGGIRCEKLSAYMIERGYDNIYQLHGGILKYLETMPEDKSKWQGSCYVFDERVSVKHGLEVDTEASMCNACGHALTAEDRASPEYRKDEHCPYCDAQRIYRSPPFRSAEA